MNQELAQEALSRARSGQPCVNDALVIAEFVSRGIPEADIRPRENCLTFWAWKALARSVKKGEHGVAIVTWIPITRTDEATGEKIDCGTRPRTAYVFHESQTELTRESRRALARAIA